MLSVKGLKANVGENEILKGLDIEARYGWRAFVGFIILIWFVAFVALFLILESIRKSEDA
jgi:hypothetical protein